LQRELGNATRIAVQQSGIGLEELRPANDAGEFGVAL
jgi:hypothetical protein